MAANDLRALTREKIAGLDNLLRIGGDSIQVRLIEPLHVLSMRLLPGCGNVIARAVAGVGLAALPGAGRFSGMGPLVLWRNPGEFLLVAQNRRDADGVLAELAPSPQALAYAVDQSDGLVTIELCGAALDEVLHRLLDATAVPMETGQGTRARLADIAVFALRLDPERAWLMVDRANDQFLARWIAYAIDALPTLT